MTRPAVLIASALLPPLLSACSDTPVAAPMRSLERSGQVAFVCVTEAGEGRDLDSCPDYDDEDGEQRSLLALVTQTLRGEVAVINLSAGRVVDIDPSTPGYGFLPIGALPQHIVSTPGGGASFVGVAEPGKEGIYALPSSCLSAPAADERTRDLTSLPACALPTIPGTMAMLFDPPDERGQWRDSCDGQYADLPAPPGAEREVCPADLSSEASRFGRHKLLVALPEWGELAILDAQSLLDREPGSFEPCAVERWIRLAVQLPPAGLEQQVPADLQAPDCVPPTTEYGPRPEQFESRPAGLAVLDGLVYLADLDAPVIHRLSVSDPCAPAELPPLLPLSYAEPGRLVTTKELAISPLTTRGERYLYAIDDRGDVIIFDVSPTASDRTPLLRSGSPLLPPNYESPDRIHFPSPAKDVEFVLRDEPVPDPVTGVALVGTRCDPDPFDSDSPGAAYRTSSNYRRGARPGQLRGVFGFVMLANGEIAIIDVEDFDAPCRRPVQSNPSAQEDFRGCSGDPLAAGVYFTEGGSEDGDRTVSGELSCRTFDQHRARSSELILNSSETGVDGPSVRRLPLLRDADGSTLLTDDTEDGRQHPKLLAVEFPSLSDPTQTVPVEVFVNTVLYGSGPELTNWLDLDPRSAERNSVGLVYRQPRAFYPNEEITVTYEGVFVSERRVGLLRLGGSEETKRLEDADARFCDRGVQDAALTREVGIELGVAEEQLDAFVRRHTDYVQLIAELPEEADSYWSTRQSVGYTCGDQGRGNGYFACESIFGTPEEPTPARELSIVEAYQNQLLIEPREPERSDILDLLYCCFGAGQVLSYVVRAGHQWVVRSSASGYQHNVVRGPELRCVRDCAPRRAWHRGRAFEVATRSQVCDGQNGECSHYACVFANPEPLPEQEADVGLPGPVPHDSPCVFQNLTLRFAVYRGQQQSERDMAFGWDLTGGFVPLTASLFSAGGTTAVLPQSLVYVPQIVSLAVTDGAQKGLTFVSLDTLAPSVMYY